MPGMVVKADTIPVEDVDASHARKQRAGGHVGELLEEIRVSSPSDADTRQKSSDWQTISRNGCVFAVIFPGMRDVGDFCCPITPHEILLRTDRRS
jgi:hypothetical protein